MEGLSREKTEFGVEDLTDAWNSRFEDKRSSFTIRRWVDFLCQIGYLTSKTNPEDKRHKLYKAILRTENICNSLILPNANVFSLETLKEWQKEANKIFAHNTLSLRENLTSEKETAIEEVYAKHFLSESRLCANIQLSPHQAPISEKTTEMLANKKCKQLQTIPLDSFKAVYWSDSFYGWHPCAVCGQTKLTSWQAETFRDEKLLLCEDCKTAWEKQQAGEA